MLQAVFGVEVVKNMVRLKLLTLARVESQHLKRLVSSSPWARLTRTSGPWSASTRSLL